VLTVPTVGAGPRFGVPTGGTYSLYCSGLIWRGLGARKDRSPATIASSSERAPILRIASSSTPCSPTFTSGKRVVRYVKPVISDAPRPPARGTHTDARGAATQHDGFDVFISDIGQHGLEIVRQKNELGLADEVIVAIMQAMVWEMLIIARQMYAETAEWKLAILLPEFDAKTQRRGFADVVAHRRLAKHGFAGAHRNDAAFRRVKLVGVARIDVTDLVGDSGPFGVEGTDHYLVAAPPIDTGFVSRLEAHRFDLVAPFDPLNRVPGDVTRHDHGGRSARVFGLR